MISPIIFDDKLDVIHLGVRTGAYLVQTNAKEHLPYSDDMRKRGLRFKGSLPRSLFRPGVRIDCGLKTLFEEGDKTIPAGCLEDYQLRKLHEFYEWCQKNIYKRVQEHMCDKAEVEETAADGDGDGTADDPIDVDREGDVSGKRKHHEASDSDVHQEPRKRGPAWRFLSDIEAAEKAMRATHLSEITYT